MAILTISGSLLPAVANLALISIPVNEARVAFDRMFEFSSIDREFTGTESTIPAIQEVQLSDLSFRYPGRKRLLEHINMELHRSKIVAIAGESGCGKSTLCQLLQKFYPPEDGRIVVDGISLDTIDTKEWRSKIGVVPQESFIFNGTVLDNILMGAPQDEISKVLEFCRETGFHRFIEMLPQSYGTIVGEEGINLSGGQKQLVDWIRVLYRRPQVLIVDEGTSAMDSQTEQFVLELLFRQKQTIATLFISHRLHLLKKWSDYIYILSDSKITDQGTHHELVSRDNLYQKYWASIHS